ncbi:MAG: ribosomal-protein-alanine N-acetyltransferase [Paraglaciecola sp.]|jgi:RimJ/RimL family protein N-acetyltransferase
MTDIKKTEISSKQVPLVYLQAICEQDTSDEYVQWLNDPLVNQYLETRFYSQNLQTVLDFIRTTTANPNEHLFAIRLKDNNQHVGNIKIGGINERHNIADVSLFIGDKNSWGKGIASQAIQLISRYSFEQLGLRKLCAGAYKPNIGSTKAFLNSGYSHDAVLTNHFTFNNQPCDLVQVCLFSHQKDKLPDILVTLHH